MLVTTVLRILLLHAWLFRTSIIPNITYTRQPPDEMRPGVAVSILALLCFFLRTCSKKFCPQAIVKLHKAILKSLSTFCSDVCTAFEFLCCCEDILYRRNIVELRLENGRLIQRRQAGRFLRKTFIRFFELFQVLFLCQCLREILPPNASKPFVDFISDGMYCLYALPQTIQRMQHLDIVSHHQMWSCVLIRSTARLVFSRSPNDVRRKYPSPQGPKPAPGVPTMLTSVSSLSKKSHEGISFGVFSQM